MRTDFPPLNRDFSGSIEASTWTQSASDARVENIQVLGTMVPLALKCVSGAVLSFRERSLKLMAGLLIEPFAEAYASLSTDSDFRIATKSALLDDQSFEIFQRMLTSNSDDCIKRLLINGVIVPLYRSAERIIQNSDLSLDRPRIRCLDRMLRDISTLHTWALETNGKTACAGFESVSPARPPQHQLTCKVDDLQRLHCSRRQPNEKTFGHTRRYREAAPELFGQDEYRNACIELAWTNRDEVDAVETFALVLFDLLNKVPAAMIRDLGQFCADEARHAMIGEHLLFTYGVNADELPVSTIGIDLRIRMRGWTALAQISLFGEAGIIGPMRALAHDAKGRHDFQTANAFAAIVRDELFHLKCGMGWLLKEHPDSSLEAIENNTKAKAAEILSELGIVNIEYYLGLSRKEICDLVGE